MRSVVTASVLAISCGRDATPRTEPDRAPVTVRDAAPVAPIDAAPMAAQLVPIYRDLALGPDISITYTCARASWRRITDVDLGRARITVEELGGDARSETHRALSPDDVARIRADLASALAGGPYAPERGDGPMHCSIGLTSAGAMEAFFHIAKDRATIDDAISRLVHDAM